MSVATTQGPVFGPALRFSAAQAPQRAVPRRPIPTAVSETAARALPLRRQIGFGARAIMVTNPALFRTPRRHRTAMPTEPARNRSKLYAAIVGALLVSAGAMGLSAAMDTSRSLMDKNEYAAGRRAIEADARLNISKCRDVDGAARDLCRAEARADERIRKADLEATYRGTVAAAADARLERAKAQYEIARAKCSDRHGSDRLECMKAARADKARALAEAKKPAAT